MNSLDKFFPSMDASRTGRDLAEELVKMHRHALYCRTRPPTEDNMAFWGAQSMAIAHIYMKMFGEVMPGIARIPDRGY